MKDWKPATLAAQAAGAQERETGGIVPGISVTSTYGRGPDYALLRPGNIYGRDENETVRQAEAVIRALEGAAATRLFPSGMAAIAAAFRTVPGGGRVVMQSGIYWGTVKWAREFCARRGITLDEVEASDLSLLSGALSQKADLVWIEVPSNPWLKLVNIEEAVTIAHAAGAVLAVDATAATPVLMRPLEMGADLVMHSATKGLNGHSDVVAGGLSVKDEGLPAWQAICSDRHDAGAILGPFEAWLLMRGMRTLPLRVERSSENALRLAQALENHDALEAVWYPGLATHPQHALAQRQMQGGYGCLVSILVKGGFEAAARVVSRLQVFHRATSLGGVESLVEHRHVIEPHTGIPENLLRLSVGIEDAGDLIADIEQALR
ncbi:aminotransferase class I/II-fold pyridoxal phosphate-dependent enzyme [Roseovarius sp. A21]|uniref:Aminotransferase class I/II-fold pyridoxal phosphate-dependent enzyme n=1 Tax=Roseovarius bejariae TaxID=2576383 RepID=A0A844CTH3_9RHOB|nr:aminotransferase class I/II-fold pyridoxal phosphate-dependent enzyme [Roseovarius bejariae]MRU13990.1 aminotransferase class I/II-fold pyridoxal phosphate-dependent enzyme [Roseovarius bejariae]